MCKFISTFDNRPSKTGWYAILICWEIEEGFFPGAAYWDGEKFTTPSPVSNFIDTPFLTEEEAESFAKENDPNW